MARRGMKMRTVLSMGRKAGRGQRDDRDLPGFHSPRAPKQSKLKRGKSKGKY